MEKAACRNALVASLRAECGEIHAEMRAEASKKGYDVEGIEDIKAGSKYDRETLVTDLDLAVDLYIDLKTGAVCNRLHSNCGCLKAIPPGPLNEDFQASSQDFLSNTLKNKDPLMAALTADSDDQHIFSPEITAQYNGEWSVVAGELDAAALAIFGNPLHQVPEPVKLSGINANFTSTKSKTPATPNIQVKHASEPITKSKITTDTMKGSKEAAELHATADFQERHHSELSTSLEDNAHRTGEAPQTTELTTTHNSQGNAATTIAKLEMDVPANGKGKVVVDLAPDSESVQPLLASDIDALGGGQGEGNAVNPKKATKKKPKKKKSKAQSKYLLLLFKLCQPRHVIKGLINFL